MRRTRVFPPSPDDREAWRVVVQTAPDLAPALSRSGIVQTSAFHFAAILAADPPPIEEPSTGGVDGGRVLQPVVSEANEALAQPAIECAVRELADGLASRTRALKLLGNGVCPLAAANAWRHLARDLGLAPLDLGAACQEL